MFYRVLCFVAAVFYKDNLIVLGADTEVQTSIKDANQAALEFFHNCTCIPYFRCGEINNYILAFKSQTLPENAICSNPRLFCCKNTSNPEPEPDSTTTAKPTKPDDDIPTTTAKPTLRFYENVQGCGLARTELSVRILNPETDSASTIAGEIPWMVEIFQKRKNAKMPYRLKCAGSLIHQKVVLTATHCVASNKPEQLKIVATGKEVFQNVGVNPEDERNVLKIIKHPDYYSGAFYNDIALLILDNEYNFSTSYLNSICLPAVNESFSSTRCLGVGWGENANLDSIPLKKVDIPIVDSQECQDLLRKTRLGEDFTLHSSFTCAGGEEGKDTCKGDGGGPLICIGKNYEYVAAGIVSWGVDIDKCGIAGQPGLYTDVGRYKNWIEDELKKNNITLN